MVIVGPIYIYLQYILRIKNANERHDVQSVSTGSRCYRYINQLSQLSYSVLGAENCNFVGIIAVTLHKHKQNIYYMYCQTHANSGQKYKSGKICLETNLLVTGSATLLVMERRSIYSTLVADAAFPLGVALHSKHILCRVF